MNFVRKTLDFVKIDSEVHQFYEKPLKFFSNRPVLRRRQIYQITPAVLQARERGHVGSENFGRPIAIRRSEIDRNVNFAKKTRALLK